MEGFPNYAIIAFKQEKQASLRNGFGLREKAMRPFTAHCLLALAALSMLAFSVDGARAQSVKDVFEKYGLLGTWAQDCSKPPDDRSNWTYINRVVDANTVQRDYMKSATERGWYIMLTQATPLGPKEVRLSGLQDGHIKVDGTWRVEQDRVWQWEATKDGKKIIDNGRHVAGNGRELPPLNRCGTNGRQGTAPANTQVAGIVGAIASAPAQRNETPPPQTIAAASGSAPSGSSGRGCKTENYTFSTLYSRGATTNSVSIGGAACLYSVAPLHPGELKFDSVSIAAQPRNGKFEQTGSYAFKYQPSSGFRGADEVAIKVCGHNDQRSGCATVTYRVSVQ